MSTYAGPFVELYNAALAAFNSREYNQAYAYAQQALARLGHYPAELGIIFLIISADSLRHLGNWAEAERYCQACLDLLEPYERRSIWFEGQEMFSAQEVCDQIAMGYYNMGICRLEQKLPLSLVYDRFLMAASKFGDAGNKQGRADALWNAANALMDSGQYGMALKVCLDLSEATDNQTDRLRFLGRALQAARKEGNADARLKIGNMCLESARRLAAGPPGAPEVTLGYCVVAVFAYREARRIPLMAEAANTGVSLPGVDKSWKDYRLVQMHKMLADAYALAEQAGFTQAERLLDEIDAIAESKEYTDMRELLQELHREWGVTDSARSPEFLERARAALGAGDLQRAGAILKNLKAIHPKDERVTQLGVEVAEARRSLVCKCVAEARSRMKAGDLEGAQQALAQGLLLLEDEPAPEEFGAAQREFSRLKVNHLAQEAKRLAESADFRGAFRALSDARALPLLEEAGAAGLDRLTERVRKAAQSRAQRYWDSIVAHVRQGRYDQASAAWDDARREGHTDLEPEVGALSPALLMAKKLLDANVALGEGRLQDAVAAVEAVLGDSNSGALHDSARALRGQARAELSARRKRRTALTVVGVVVALTAISGAGWVLWGRSARKVEPPTLPKPAPVVETQPQKSVAAMPSSVEPASSRPPAPSSPSGRPTLVTTSETAMGGGAIELAGTTWTGTQTQQEPGIGTYPMSLSIEAASAGTITGAVQYPFGVVEIEGSSSSGSQDLSFTGTCVRTRAPRGNPIIPFEFHARISGKVMTGRGHDPAGHIRDTTFTLSLMSGPSPEQRLLPAELSLVPEMAERERTRQREVAARDRSALPPSQPVPPGAAPTASVPLAPEAVSPAPPMVQPAETPGSVLYFFDANVFAKGQQITASMRDGSIVTGQVFSVIPEYLTVQLTDRSLRGLRADQVAEVRITGQEGVIQFETMEVPQEQGPAPAEKDRAAMERMRWQMK